jgi:hypothetical protein
MPKHGEDVRPRHDSVGAAPLAVFLAVKKLGARLGRCNEPL